MGLEFTKTEAKQWAKENLKGLEGVIHASYTPDLSGLDEEGIRWDVNYLIANKLSCILCAVEASAMTFEERKQFVEIVCDEAKDKIHVSMTILQNTVEEDLEMLAHFEKVGGSFALIFPAMMPRSPSCRSKAGARGVRWVCCQISNPPPPCRFKARAACLSCGCPPVYGSIRLATAFSSKTRMSIPKCSRYHFHAA